MKTVIASLNDVPEALRGEYVEKDGRYVLRLEGTPAGFVPASDVSEVTAKLAEFRGTNSRLLAALGASSPEDGIRKAESLKSVDLDEYTKLKARVEGLSKMGIKDGDDIDARMKAHAEQATSELRRLVEQEREQRVKAQKAADDALLRSVISAKFQEVGGLPKALDFIVARAADTFMVEGGQVKARPDKFSPERPTQPMSMDEWFQLQAKEADFAFKPSGGAGASPAATPSSYVPRPGVKAMVNPTPEQLGELKYEHGKGLVNRQGEVVEIVETATPAV